MVKSPEEDCNLYTNVHFSVWLSEIDTSPRATVQSGGKPVFHLEMTRWNRAEISLQVILLQYNNIAAHLLSTLHSQDIFSSSTAYKTFMNNILS